MRRRLLDFLACPKCRKSFRLSVSEQSGEEVLSGSLECSGCAAVFPVLRGIPRILPRLSRVEERTAAAFGYEWRNFREHYAYYERQFLSWVEPVRPEFFRGKVVLDAGCGMGRNLYYASRFGAKVAIGLDLSEAVESAYEMCRGLDNVHVVQGDICNPPFRQCFGYVFSVGVLHHLPVPRRGFDSLLSVLRPGGWVSVWVYGREGNFLVRTVGSFVRVYFTSRLPHWLLKALCFPLAVVLHVLTKFVYRPLSLRWMPYGEYFIALADFDFRNKLSIVFDHLVPPVAFYIGRPEVSEWFYSRKLGDVVISSRFGNSWRGFGRKG